MEWRARRLVRIYIVQLTGEYLSGGDKDLAAFEFLVRCYGNKRSYHKPLTTAKISFHVDIHFSASFCTSTRVRRADLQSSINKDI